MSETTTHDNTTDNTEIITTDHPTHAARHGEVVDAAPPFPAGELARRTRPDAALAVTPQVAASELVQRLAVIREAMHNAMQEGVDYGRIPGTDKPALHKPGAEKLGVLFQLDIQVTNEKRWGPGDHLLVISRATVYHAPSGTRLGSGEGTCSTRERKYAYRRQERTCPHCQATAVIKGKDEFGGGWLCWKKRDGCGAKFPDGAESIESQPVGEIENPDLPDLWNTIVKMAAKRARIDAVLAVTGASALFTQDIDDQQPGADEDRSAHEQALAAGAPASDELRRATMAALRWLLGDPAAADRAAQRIGADYAHLPVAAGRALVHAAGELAKAPDTPDEAPVATAGANIRATAEGDASGQAPQTAAPSEPSAEAWTAPVHAQLLEGAHQHGYQQATVHSVCDLMLDKAIDQLDDAERWQLSTLLETASAGAIRDEHLARAVQRGLEYDDRAEARSRLYRWLIDHASGAQGDQQAA